MVMFILYTLLHILFIFVDFVPIYKNKKRKLLWVYSIMLTFSYVILILISVNIKIPSSASVIKKLITSIYPI